MNDPIGYIVVFAIIGFLIYCIRKVLEWTHSSQRRECDSKKMDEEMYSSAEEPPLKRDQRDIARVKSSNSIAQRKKTERVVPTQSPKTTKSHINLFKMHKKSDWIKLDAILHRKSKRW